MTSQNNISRSDERDQALIILDDSSSRLTLTYKECYLSTGRGALLVYAQDIISGTTPNNGNYRTKNEMLEIFDEPRSQAKLNEMINNYNPKNEGIMALITSQSNATYFVTFKFKLIEWGSVLH